MGRYNQKTNDTFTAVRIETVIRCELLKKKAVLLHAMETLGGEEI
jgi:hypothetical protein